MPHFSEAQVAKLVDALLSGGSARNGVAVRLCSCARKKRLLRQPLFFVMIRVILLIDCASEFDRKLLRGMMRYSRENGPWLFYRMPSGFSWGQDREEWVLEWARTWKADAIIGRWDEIKVNLLSRLNIPIVLQNNKSRSDTYSNLTGDYEGTGRMAARYFRKKLFTDFAFFGVRNIIWSEERCAGFRDEVSACSGHFFSYKIEPAGTFDRDALAAWLEGLPKPVAMFCCDDAHALMITETCKMSGIRIPEDISMLGVDNDDLLCNISDPPISSIDLDVENGGYLTCKYLHEFLSGKRTAPFNVIINPTNIVDRQSSRLYNISDPYVEKIVSHIDDNYNTDMSMNELFAQVPLSRRSIEMRFRNETGTTVYQYLMSVRIEHFAYLLATTRKTVMEIAYEVGFSDSSNISRIFKKIKGCSPQEYRRSKNIRL